MNTYNMNIQEMNHHEKSNISGGGDNLMYDIAYIIGVISRHGNNAVKQGYTANAMARRGV